MKLEFDMNIICGKCGIKDKHHFKFYHIDDKNFEIVIDDKTIFKKGLDN
jgi:hypothetical protein